MYYRASYRRVFFHLVDTYVPFVSLCHYPPYFWTLKSLIGRANVTHYFLYYLQPLTSIYLVWPSQALPIFLDRIFHPVVAVILSVTFVLAFGEVFIWCPKFTICSFYSLTDCVVFRHQVIPQAICTRYGLAVGANFVWLVRILMVLCYPIAYPIGKVNQQNRTIQF